MDPPSEPQYTNVSSLYFNFSVENRAGESIVRQNVATTGFVTPVLIAFVVLGFIGSIIILHAICTAKRFNRITTAQASASSQKRLYIWDLAGRALLSVPSDPLVENRAGESIVRQNVATTGFVTPVLIAFVVLGFIGNIIILHAICTAKRFNRAENLMLANFSVSSALILMCTVSFYIQMTFPLTHYGPFYCKLYPGIHTFMITAQGFTMICISLERTERVRFILMRASKSSEFKKIALIWSLAIMADIPRGLLFYQYDPNMKNLIKCYNTKEIFDTQVPFVIYATTSYVLTYLLPSIWLARDWICLVSQLHFLIACQTLPLHNEYRKRQKKLIRHAIIFTSIFIAVEVPCGTHALLYQLPRELLSESVILWVKTWENIFFSAQLLHGSFYPFIIFALSGDMRKYIFCSKFDRHRRPQYPLVARIT